MAIKLGRSYKIIIQTPDGETLQIEPNISADIKISRSVLSSVNTASVSIYNLKKTTRSLIYKDRYEIVTYWQIQIYGGYGENLVLIFQGNITQSQSKKMGTEWVTEIEAADGMTAIQNGITSRTISAGTTLRDTIGQLITDMPNVILGAIGEQGSGSSERGQVVFGSTAEQMTKLTGGQWFIDSERLNILGDDEYLRDLEALVLDGANMFSTPQRSETILVISTLFEPLAQVGGLAEVRSSEEIYNGQYKIIGIEHDVSFSQAQSGNATTTLKLNSGEQVLSGVDYE